MTATEYRRPEFVLHKIKLIDVTDEQMVAFKKNAAEVDLHNRLVREERKAALAKLVADAEALFGRNHNAVKYLRRQQLETPWTGDFASFQMNVERVRKEAAAERARAEAEIAQNVQTERAVAWLVERGRKIGDDFSLTDALKVANTLAYEQECERRAAELRESGDFVEFEGQNCNSWGDEVCLGWDGESHRCECGNQRVYWEQGYGHSFEKPYVYAAWH